jgi:hypothetical protein
MLPRRMLDWTVHSIILCCSLYSKVICLAVIALWAAECGLNTDGRLRVFSRIPKLSHDMLLPCHYLLICCSDSWLTWSLWSQGWELIPSCPSWGSQLMAVVWQKLMPQRVAWRPILAVGGSCLPHRYNLENRKSTRTRVSREHGQDSSPHERSPTTAVT